MQRSGTSKAVTITAPYPCCTGSGTGTCPNVKAFGLDGSSQYLSLTTIPSLGGANSIFTVSAGHLGNAGDLFAYGASGTAGCLYAVYYSTYYGFNGSDFTHYNDSASSTASNTTIFYTFEGTNNSSWVESNYKINGGTSITPTLQSTDYVCSTPNFANIGWCSAPLCGYWNGQFASLLLFNVQLSSGDMTIIRNLLNTMYGHY
jgi:hypothetical protein